MAIDRVGAGALRHKQNTCLWRARQQSDVQMP